MSLHDDDTLPPMPQRTPPSGKEIVLSLIVVVIVLALLSGCASKKLPICPDAEIRAFVAADGQTYRLVDERNWQAILATVRGLAEGKCRVPLGQEV